MKNIFFHIALMITSLIIGCTTSANHIYSDTQNGMPSNYTALKIDFMVEDKFHISGQATTPMYIVRENDGSNSTLPKVTQKTAPVYPSIAVREKVEGIVIARAIVNSVGKLQRVSIERSDAELFNQSVLDAVGEWKFSPLYYNGVGTDYVAKIPISFMFEGSKPRVVLPR
jgi:TonB family protein